MVNISDEDVAVLGLLHEHHHYAFRIQEIMEKRGMDKWANIDISSVNSILEKLESNNLIQSKLPDNNGKTSDKVYYITNEGKIALKKKIKAIIAGEIKLIYPFDLGLANMHVLSNDEIIKNLNIYLESIEDRLQSLEYAVMIQTENNIPTNFIAIYSRSIELLKAEKKWLKDFMDNTLLKSNQNE
jgi:DNA-binding PadR family transcriptional regulator